MAIPGFMMTAPTVAAKSGLAASIIFPQPNTASVPYSYTVTQTDITADASAAAALSGDPVITDGTVALTVVDLIEGHAYTFVVTVTSQSDGATTTSAASTPITATT
ncbi:hypothetical protein KXD96_28070 (plasmid) [Mycobacterium sp. SMC-2]|uniref:hypothetical protein n=1 Tax=Mycobacterium sp. SMC-2 TaxID=2857058 RepID=UPI0021B386AE|nr:hypothetical protein [Mycobacterium sp. SMC-2]UXA06594.1 hypothetical protein KXD96_27925 [Mycobacterium sp. SMC-2]UXA09688.1 hypothetical protein KXD96_28070 [Mycobacterium sp. SMC-2]